MTYYLISRELGIFRQVCVLTEETIKVCPLLKKFVLHFVKCWTSSLFISREKINTSISKNYNRVIYGQYILWNHTNCFKQMVFIGSSEETYIRAPSKPDALLRITVRHTTYLITYAGDKKGDTVVGYRTML